MMLISAFLSLYSPNRLFSYWNRRLALNRYLWRLSITQPSTTDRISFLSTQEQSSFVGKLKILCSSSFARRNVTPKSFPSVDFTCPRNTLVEYLTSMKLPGVGMADSSCSAELCMLSVSDSETMASFKIITFEFMRFLGED